MVMKTKEIKGLSLSVMLVLYTLFATFPSDNWQGYGNMSSSNITEIWDFINPNIQSAIPAKTYDAFNTKFSEHLNTLWNPAWNVFTIQAPAGIDAIVYGYAFRQHWMWYNGYASQSKNLNFIIWKDYNCQTWMTLGQTGASSGFIDAQKSAIGSALSSVADFSDVWATAKFLSNTILATDVFKGEAISIVSCNKYTDTFIYGRVCGLNNKQLRAFSSTNERKIIFFQPR